MMPKYQAASSFQILFFFFVFSLVFYFCCSFFFGRVSLAHRGLLRFALTRLDGNSDLGKLLFSWDAVSVVVVMLLDWFFSVPLAVI